MNKKQSWNVTAVYLLLIFSLTAATLLHRQRSFSQRENRALSQKPKVTPESVLNGDFESDYESYLTDQFVGRDTWIALKTTAQRLMGKTEDHDVYFAKDDYLIEKHTGTFTDKQAEANIAYLQSFITDAKANKKFEHVSVMIVPNAVDILRDKLPAFAYPYDEESYLQKIKDALPEGVYMDVSSVLSSHKEEEIYYRTDHHWTSLGAFYAWQVYADKVGLGEKVMEDYDVIDVTDAFEGTVAAKVGTKVMADTIRIMPKKDGAQYLLTYNQTDDVRSTVYQENALEGRDKYAYFYGGNYGLVQAKTTAKTGKRILVIKDSYAHCFMPFLYDEYEQADMLDLRYYNSSLKELIEAGGYTDVLFLYNAAGFAEDVSLAKLTM